MEKLNLYINFAIFTLLVLFFQNCSQVKFDSLTAAGGATVAGAPNGSDPQASPDAGGTPAPGASPSADDKSCDDKTAEQEAKDEEDKIAKMSNESSANCQSAAESIAKSTVLASGANVSGLKGTFFYSGTQVGAVSGVDGEFTFVSLDPNAKIKSLSEAAGDIYICNMDVGTIGKVAKGRIIVINGNVDSVEDFSGYLEVRNGKVGTVKNNTGRIEVK